MIYAFIIGCVLGYSEESFYLSAGVLLGLIIFKTLWDIAFKTQWITASPSNYVLYLNNLTEQGSVNKKPWLSYLFLSIATGAVSGAVGYAVAYYIF